MSVQTDHKPLESILKKPLCKAPPRLQRLMLRLQPYDLDVHYVSGKYMYLADTLSRAYIQGESIAELEDELSRIVHSLVVNIPVSASKLSEIRQATAQDPTLRKVKDLIVTGWPKSRKSVPPEVQNLWNMRDELHVAEDVIFVGENSVGPRETSSADVAPCPRKSHGSREIQSPSSNCHVLARHVKGHRRRSL